MTISERNNKLKHFITCLKCEVSGKCCDDNCSTQYDAGNMGEIIENLEAISKVLEQEPTSKNNLAHNLCDSCTNIRCEFQSGIVRTKCAFYMPPQHLSGLEKNSKKLEKDFGELDCISRADVIKILGKIEQLVWEGEGFDYEESRAMIDELPSVTPIRPKGHWITETPRNKRRLGARNGYCSVCKDFYTDDWDIMNYCPNCGADMREVEE